MIKGRKKNQEQYWKTRSSEDEIFRGMVDRQQTDRISQQEKFQKHLTSLGLVLSGWEELARVGGAKEEGG